MAKLYFRYGAMGASKTAQALMTAYNYTERDKIALLLKPAIDTREGITIIKSRCGLKADVTLVDSETNIWNLVFGMSPRPDCIIIDESQFLSKHNIENLCSIVDRMNIPVICYGLRSDFQGCLFEGSKWLMAWADTIEEIKTICWCGRKANFNARLNNGKIVKDGDQIQIGGNESYIALCRGHWKDGIIERKAQT